MTTTDLDIRLFNLFNEAEDYFGKAVCDRFIDIGNVATAYCSHVRESPLNALVIRSDNKKLHTVLAAAHAFFAESSWSVVMRAHLLTAEVIQRCNEFGLLPSEQSVAMYREFSDNDQFSADTDDFRNMDKRLAEWILPLRAFPASLGEVPVTYKESHELALQRGRNLRHESCFYNDIITSSLTLSWNNNWARIDDVATSPEFQRMGFATRLMQHALSIARSKKARYCFLEASQQGLSTYEKIGFKTLFRNQVFSR